MGFEKSNFKQKRRKFSQNSSFEKKRKKEKNVLSSFGENQVSRRMNLLRERYSTVGSSRPDRPNKM